MTDIKPRHLPFVEQLLSTEAVSSSVRFARMFGRLNLSLLKTPFTV